MLVNRRPHPRVKAGFEHQGGFTLFEVLVVVVILGLVMGIAVTSGPNRSRTIEMQTVVDQVARSVRLARARAIAQHREVRLVLDAPAHSLRLDGAIPTPIPNTMRVSMTTTAAESINAALTAIRFNPDGSSSGGRIELAEGSRHVLVGIDWLTSRISIVHLQ